MRLEHDLCVVCEEGALGVESRELSTEQQEQQEQQGVNEE